MGALLEGFAKEYSQTIAALSALGTWAAVLVALYLSSISRRPRLTIVADKEVYIPSEAQRADGSVDWFRCEDAIGVTLRNIGSVTCYVSYWAFSWRVPFCRGALQQNPLRPDFRREGLKIEPGQAVTISLTDNLPRLSSELEGLCKKAGMPIALKRLTRLEVHSQDGYRFKARIGLDLKKDVLRQKYQVAQPRQNSRAGVQLSSTT